MLNNCNRVNNNSIMTVFIEKLRMRVRYVHRIRFSIRLDSIDTLSLADCKKHKKKQLRKMRCLSAQERSKSVGVVKAAHSSQLVYFLSQYLLYLL